MLSPSRFIFIGWVVYGHLGWWLLVRLRPRPLRPSDTPALRFTRMLERLGTAFVKLGQAMSLHAEILPADYVSALASLQDHVAPFPGEQAVREIERSFGRTVAELFATFAMAPIAAGSIAQVHAARLHDGREVIVKVLRPGIKRQIEQDMKIMAFFVRLLLVVMPGWRRFDPLGLIEEALRNLRQEMDFLHEARSIRRFAAMFKDSPTIFVPPAIEGLQSEWVGVQHMSAGLRIDDPQLKDSGPALAQAFVDAYLKQLFAVGVFHGDPHPGNLFIMADGRICFHDFGLVGFLDHDTRRQLAAFMQAFVLQDAEWLLASARDLGLFMPDGDSAALSGSIEELLADFVALPLREWSFAEAMLRVTRMGTGRHTRMPRTLLVLTRTLLLMEGSVRTLDPGFDLRGGLLGKGAAELKTAMAAGGSDGGWTRVKYEAEMAWQQVPQHLGSVLRNSRRGTFAIKVDHGGLEKLQENIERASSRMALSMVALGLYIAASLLMQHSIGPQLFGLPVLGMLGYFLAGWLTLRVVRGVGKE